MVLSLAAAAVAALITPLRPQLCGASAPTPPAPHYPLRRGPWVVTMCYSETQRVQVAVPEGLVEGDTLRIAFNGQEYLVEVPRGCAAGMEFEVDVPAAPAAAPTSQDVPDAACTDAAAELMSPPPPSLSLPPPPVGAAGLEEVWLTPRRDDRPLGECIRGGEVVVCVPDVASPPELAALFSAGLAACDGRGRSQNAAVGRNRFAVSDPTAFTRDVVLGCEEILLRVLDRIDEELPSVYETLFEPSDGWLGRQPLTVTVPLTESPPPHLAETCPGLRELYMAGELEWSEGEPAINVYTEKVRVGRGDGDGLGWAGLGWAGLGWRWAWGRGRGRGELEALTRAPSVCPLIRAASARTPITWRSQSSSRSPLPPTTSPAAARASGPGIKF